MRDVVVVGCGNPDAADDAVGVLAVREARTALEAIPGVRVTLGAIGPDLTDLLAHADAAIVVDAIRTPGGARPSGTLVRAEAGPDGLTEPIGASLSSHGFGVAEAVSLAAALGVAPAVVVLGIEVGDVTVGGSRSPAVERALPELRRLLLEEAMSLASST